MIPLSTPNLSGNEWKYIKDCLDTNWVSSVGSYVNELERVSAEFCGVKKAVAVSNGTAALHLSLMLANVKPGDLVIIPNITFVAPVNVIKYVGADPVLIDVDKNTWQMDIYLLEQFLSEECVLQGNKCYHKTTNRCVSAIIPVHVLGNMVDMDKLLSLAEQYFLCVIEDATEALGSTYKGQPAGSLGLFGCLSYNGNKIITTGGGGMILTNNETLGIRAKHLSTQAKADAIEYFHDEVGYNYRLVNILAAMGVAQMEQLPGFVVRKKQVAKQYTERLEQLPGFAPQVVTEGVNPNCWLYTAMFKDAKKLFAFLEQHKIQTRPFWIPMNQLPAFKEDIYYNLEDVSKDVYERSLSLPCSTNIQDKEIDFIVEKIHAFYA